MEAQRGGGRGGISCAEAGSSSPEKVRVHGEDAQVGTAPSAQALREELQLKEGLCSGRPHIFYKGGVMFASYIEDNYLIATWESSPVLFLRASRSHLFAFPFEGMDDKNATKLNELIQAG